MYAISQVIYGYPLVSNDKELDLSEELCELVWSDAEEDGWLHYYSGSATDEPAAFGIEIDEFDEACAYVDTRKLKMTPTQADIDKFNELFDKLEPEIQEELRQFGEPFVFFLWSTS